MKLEYSESEPTEPTDGNPMMAGTSALTTEEEWCSEQLYQLLVQKCEGPALDIIRNQNTKGKWACRMVQDLTGGRRPSSPEEVRDHRKGVPT